MFRCCFVLKSAARRSFFYGAVIAVAMGCSSCASVGGPALQPEINGLLVADRAALAVRKITAQEADYGAGNYVLYHLDRALVLQMAGNYASSIRSLAKAKARQEELYTRSVAKEAMTWMVNDNMAPYRAPEYERVLMNVFQAFNYLYMGDLNEALVEARDLDSKFPVLLSAVGSQERKRGFEDNGFARLLTGILYEAGGARQERNDALIAYRQALAVYDAYYDGKYVPRILQQALLRLAEEFNDEGLGTYRARFTGVDPGLQDGAAVVYLFESTGFSPIRVPEIIPVPVDRGFVTKVAFPKFMKRVYDTRASRLRLTDASGRDMPVDTELGVDIEDLADKDLEARKIWVLSKSVVRPALKYLVERDQKEAIEKKHGRVAADVFGLFSNLYNFYTEQADLRSWQALPAQVRVARAVVAPGAYRISIEDLDAAGVPAGGEDKGFVELKAGQTYFFIRRSAR